jgi:hypothetical protein
MASFSVSHSVHERIRIQAAADSQAFSIAVLEARGFNTMAYMNRAIAGGIVAELGLHAWRSIAARDVSMYMAGFISFLMVAAQEFAQCPKFKIQHCIHGIQALRIAFKYMSKYRSTKSDLEGKDQKWRVAVKGLSDMIKKVHEDQKGILDKVKSAINGGLVLQRIQSKSAPNALMERFDEFNKAGLACAVEGSNFDSDCQAGSMSWKKTVGVLGAGERTKIMESAAKAARNPLEIGRMGSRSLSQDRFHSSDPLTDALMPSSPISIMLNPLDTDVSNNPKNMMEIQGNEGSYREMSILAQNLDVSNNRMSASEPISFVMVQWKHGNGFFITNGSAPNSSGDYEGVPCNGSGGCFINFRLASASQPPDDDTDYGQPATYGGMSQDLRTIKGGGKGAWEIDDKGEVQMPGTNKKMKYVPSNRAYAVAKGKTYFHQLGSNGWQVAPNMFDPFWRAKLNPFLRKELAETLNKIGDSKGQEVINQSQTSVEGVTK